MDAREVTREIRRVVWPALGDEGFSSFTGRTAWRYVGDDIDVVNFQSFSASLADSISCTTFSFAVNLGLWLPPDAWEELNPKRERRSCARTHMTDRISGSSAPMARTSRSAWPTRCERFAMKACRGSRRHGRNATRACRLRRDEVLRPLIRPQHGRASAPARRDLRPPSGRRGVAKVADDAAKAPVRTSRQYAKPGDADPCGAESVNRGA